MEVKNFITNTITSFYSNELLKEMHVNDIFRGKVVEVSGNLLTLRLSDGSNIEALLTTDTKINPGDIIHLRLLEKSNGKILAKLNDVNRVNASFSENVIEDLLSLGVNPSKSNIEIIRHLKNYGVSISKESFEYVGNITNVLAGLNPRDVAYLLSKGIVLSSNDIAAAEILKGRYDSIATLNELESIISGIEFSNQASQMRQALISFISNAFSDTESGNPDVVKSKMQTNEKILHIIKNIQDTIDNSEGVNLNVYSESVNSLQNKVSFLNELQNQVLYYQFPLSFSNFRTTGKLFILKRNKGEKINPQNMAFLFSFETKNLGQVDTFIKILNRNIELSISVANDRIINFMRKYSSEMNDIITNLGYNLASFDLRLQKVKIDLLNIDEYVDYEFFGKQPSIDLKI